MAQVYKTFTRTDLDNKAAIATTATQKQKISEIVSNFIAYFKAKHM